MSRLPDPSSPAAPGKSPALLEQHLFFDSSINAYAVIDGASAKGFLPLLRKHNPPHHCLYRGELPEDVAEAAPYVVELRPDNPLTQTIIYEGWGKHWGIFAQTAADLRMMRKHFRTFLMVNGDEGTPLYFRYYDPRVLQSFLPTCTTHEAAVIFGPVRAYLLEAGDKTMLRFRLHDSTHLPISERVTQPPDIVAERIAVQSADAGRYGNS